MERRTYATFKKQWPNAEEVNITVTSPILTYEEYFQGDLVKEQVISILSHVQIMYFDDTRCYGWGFTTY